MKLEPVNHADICRIVGRLNVSEGYLTACRYVLRTLDKGKPFSSLDKNHKRYILAATIQHHAENRAEYKAVMWRDRRVFAPRYFFNPDTKETVIK